MVLQFDDDSIVSRWKSERARRRTARTEILSIEINRRARGIGNDFEQSDLRTDAIEIALDHEACLRIGLSRQRGLVLSEGLGVPAEALVTPRNVERNIWIGD